MSKSLKATLVEEIDYRSLLSPCLCSEAIRLALHVPAKDRNGEMINQAFWVTKTAQLFSHIFGGATVSETQQGFWLNPDTHELLHEDVISVVVFADPVDLQ